MARHLTRFFCAMLENTAGSGTDEEDMIKDIAGVAYFAGADNTVSTVITFFLAMVLHPKVQR